jgi:hypothetical protein
MTAMNMSVSHFTCLLHLNSSASTIEPMLAIKQFTFATCIKGKGKLVPVLNSTKHYAMKTYGRVDI